MAVSPSGRSVDQHCAYKKENRGVRPVAWECAKAPVPGHRRQSPRRRRWRQETAGQSKDCRTVVRRATIREAAYIHGRADLRDRSDDLREAIGERTADQPIEPAR